MRVMVGQVLTIAALQIAAGQLAAQAQSAASPPPMPIDTATLGSGPFSRMTTLFEKTIFKVDVLTLEVRLGVEDTRRVESLASGRAFSKPLADSIGQVAIHSQDAWAQIEFLRGASLEQFLDGIDDNLRKARDAGIIDQAAYSMISQGLPRWFGFLGERQIHKGDRIVYRITGDRLRTQYWSASGELLLDQVDEGPERRLAVLGSYFVRGSDFRDGLIKTLFRKGV